MTLSFTKHDLHTQKLQLDSLCRNVYGVHTAIRFTRKSITFNNNLLSRVVYSAIIKNTCINVELTSYDQKITISTFQPTSTIRGYMPQATDDVSEKIITCTQNPSDCVYDALQTVKSIFPVIA